MKWLYVHGLAHAVVKETADDYSTACNAVIPNDPEEDGPKEVPDLHSRPFGVDTCRGCHSKVKEWASGAEELPPGLEYVPDSPEARKALSAAQRKAALAGAPQPVSMPGVPAPAPQEEAPVRHAPAPEPGSDEDLGLEPEAGPGGPAVVGGAIVIPPAPAGRRRRAKRGAADVEIDSD